MRAALLFLACTGCVLVTDAEWDKATDRDRDGHVAWQLGGDDCDDDDGAIHPGTAEVCGDNIDNDCDDAIDDDGSGNVTWYPDDDRDGHGIDAPLTGCVRPEGTLLHLDAGIDCNDAVAAIHPGAEEIWYDGVDQDCDGHDDYDQDFDGFSTIVSGGTDCDDLDDAVSPAATEVCGNHRDDDCDGTHNACAWTGDVSVDDLRHATIVWTNDPETALLVAAGDLTGDGRDDVVVSALLRSEVYVFNAPIQSTTLTGLHSDAHITVPDDTFDAVFMKMEPRVDLDGDGVSDLIVGNYMVQVEEDNRLATLAFLSPLAATPPVGAVYLGPSGFDPVVAPLASAWRHVGDLDGDDVSTWYTRTSAPLLYVVEGAPQEASIVDAAYLKVDGADVAAAIDDFDGDGEPDLLLSGGVELFVLPGSATGEIATSDLTSVYTFDAENAGLVDTGDVGGDRSDDVLAVARDALGGARVEVVFGPFGPAPTAHERFVVVKGAHADGLVGAYLADLNGDGREDLVVTQQVPYPLEAAVDVEVGVFFGPLPAGEASFGDADAILDLPADYDVVWSMVSGDVDDDGYEDLVIGSYGVAYVVYGAGR